MSVRPVGRVLLVAGFALGVMPVLGANPAYACSCVRTDEAQSFDRADVVFKGAVLGSTGAVDGKGDTGSESVTYSFAPATTYKGAASDPQDVTTSGSSASCGVNLDGAGPFLVFANQAGNDSLQMNLCGGTRPIGADEEPEFTAVETAGPTEPADQEPGGPPPAEPPAGEQEQPSEVGVVVSKVAGYLRELLEPLKE